MPDRLPSLPGLPSPPRCTYLGSRRWDGPAPAPAPPVVLTGTGRTFPSLRIDLNLENRPAPTLRERLSSIPGVVRAGCEQLAGPLPSGRRFLALWRDRPQAYPSQRIQLRPAPARQIALPPAVAGGKVSLDGRSVAVLTRQLAVMLRAGVPVHQALEVLSEGQPARLREVLLDVATCLACGETLSGALGRYPAIFSRTYLGLVRTGQGSGQLTECLERLADLQERNLKLAGKIQAALVYPALVVAVAAVVGLGFLGLVLPGFQPLFASLGTGLPGPTQLLMRVGEAVRNPWSWVAAGAVLGLVVRLRARWQGPLEGALLAVPAIFKLEAARTLFTMAALMEAGFNLISTLVQTEAASHPEIARRMALVRRDVGDGVPLAQSVREHRALPSAAVQMMVAGEESASLSVLLRRTAGFYEQEADLALVTLTSLLEPFLILGLGGVVSFLVLASVLPTLRLLDSL